MKGRIRILTLVFLMMTPALVSVTPFGLGAAQAPTTAIPEEAHTAPLDQLTPVGPSVTTGTLSNGLRYFIRENHEPENRAELRLVVNVGSIVEDDDQLGLAHFLEHMAFNGTENFEKGELVNFMESIGMRLGPGVNATTSFDETIYMLEVPTDDPANMATAFEIMEDWAHGLTLDPEEIDKERGVVIEEWRLRRGAASRLRDKQFPILFKDSQYARRLTIGTLDSLENFDHDALRRFYRDWYRPDLMGVVAIGDFEASDIEALTRQHFEDLPNPANRRERVAYRVGDHDETLFSITTDPEISSTSVSVYHKMDVHDDWTIGGYRQRIVEGLYNGMLNDRFAEISRQPNSPFLRAQSFQARLIRSKAVYALTASVLENGIERGVEALFVEAERVARFGFTSSELEREKINTMRGLERAFINRANRNSGSYASEYIRAFLDGESIPGIEYEFELYKRFVPEITLDEVDQVGQDWIHDTNRIVLVSGPEKEGLTMPGEEELMAVLAAGSEAEITAYVDTVSDQPLLAEMPEGSEIVETETIEGDITEWRLANGIRVILKPTDFEEDEIVFRGFSPGGTSLADDEDYIPASTAASLIPNGGLADFNAIDLGKVLTGKVASVRPFISALEEGVSGNASPADLETMFQLIYLRFTAPRADDTFYEVWQTQNRQALENRDRNPAAAFSDAYVRIMTQDHPRERPPTVALLDETDLYKSLEFYKDRFADAGDYTFIFVGNVDPITMKPLVERYLGGLPSTGREETWRDLGIRAPEGVIEETVHKGIEPRSQTRIAFTGPFDYAAQAERTGIRAMAMTLEARLSDRIREDLAGSYSVNVSAGYGWRPEETYTLTISFGSDPERVEELVDAVFDGIEDLKNAPPTEVEVSNTREALLRSFETSFQQNRTVLNQLVFDYQRGMEPGASTRSYPASIEAVTPESIQEAARKYFNMENRVRVTLMPQQ